MKPSEIRKLTSEEMQLKLANMQQELFNLRFQHKMDQLENPKKLMLIRRDIARIMTIKDEPRLSQDS
jgi:large subunit ribosomal protein L29